VSVTVRCSKLREVPNNQEVWIDQKGFTTIIIDITERVGKSGSGPEIDGKALTTHLEDIVGDDIDTVKVWSSSVTQFSRLRWVLARKVPLCDLTHV
jgi:hypothetical protein